MPDENSEASNHRLHALCPYFAMFPPGFAREQILRYTKPGEIVLDPFSGRGTTLLEALLNDRAGVAADINPVAYCVSAAKANPPTLGQVWDGLDELEEKYYRVSLTRLESERLRLPEFFRKAYSAETLRQILFLRGKLDWRRNRTERFIAALTLGHLHGETGHSPNFLSNQMPHTISTKPRYSVRYWAERELTAPRRDVFDLLRDRADFRLDEGRPPRSGRAVLSDVRRLHQQLGSYVGRVAAVVTSPPYYDVTSFEEDQWLRLWFLGGAARPTQNAVSKDDRHRGRENYWAFLGEAWKGIAPLLQDRAVLVCRIGARRADVTTLRDRLTATVRATWPKAQAATDLVVTTLKKSRATLLHPESVGCAYEVDFAFAVRRA